MSDDIIGGRARHTSYAPVPDLLGFITRRKVGSALCYAIYVLSIAVAAIGFESLPPKYEVAAIIDLQPATYAPDGDQTAHLQQPGEIARSQIALFTMESVIRGALADVEFPPAPAPPIPTPRARPDPSHGRPVTARADDPRAQTTNESVAALPMPGVLWPPMDSPRSPVAHAYKYFRLALGRMQDELNALETVGRRWIALASDKIFPPLPPADEAYVSARREIKARVEPNTSFIRVSFRNRDPTYAVKFLNALIRRFTEKHHELYSDAAAVSFFLDHKKESGEAFSRASAALAAFSATNHVFNIDDQRKLLLQERSRTASNLADTRDLLAQKESEATAIPHQLAQMKPIARYPQVNALAEASKHLAPPADRADSPPRIASLGSDPPLLLVKVYQNTIASLVKLNTDIAGLRAKLKRQNTEVRDIDQKLAALSAKQATFEKLQQTVELAKTRSTLFSKKAADEQIKQDLAAKKLSTVRIVQPPTRPIEPLWPPKMVAAIALLLAMLPALLLSGPAAYRVFSRI